MRTCCHSVRKGSVFGRGCYLVVPSTHANRPYCCSGEAPNTVVEGTSNEFKCVRFLTVLPRRSTMNSTPYLSATTNSEN